MMPTGYPHSVSQGFARFFLLNLFGAALAAFSLTLATQALLSSFFSHGTSVGWLLKDILPAFLTAYLAHTFINVETHPREWFIVANVITQGAVGFDFMIPFIAESSSGYFSNVVDKQTVLVGLATAVATRRWPVLFAPAHREVPVGLPTPLTALRVHETFRDLAAPTLST